jgi:hypothetical protein
MAQGFHTRADILTKLADGTDLNQLWAVYQQVVNEWNATRGGIVSFLTYNVTQPVESIPVVSQDASFEKASEFGVPKSHRPVPSMWQMGFKFDWFDLAARFTWQFLAEAPANQVDSIQNMAMEADSRLVTTEVLRTLFDNANRDVSINQFPYKVYSFYNGDGVVPPPYKTNTFNGSHTHFRGSNAATIDSGDLEQHIQDLEEHGYTVQNGYTLVTMVNRAQMNAIRTWRANTVNANSNTATYDFIPSAAAAQQILLPQNAVVVPGGTANVPSTLNGQTVMGSYGPLLILQEDFIPAGYVVSFATGGPENLQNPIGIRQMPQQELQGLRLVKGPNPDYPLIDSYYIRGFGTGVRHRGAATVTQIVASTTYTPPSSFAI